MAIGWLVFALNTAAESWSFRTDIVPVLTKAGCNAGACHGAASGQAGFHLSLLGYDPEEDYWRITREFSGRRIDLDSPADSLILRKPARQLEHEGGRKLPRGSADYETVLRWIKAGAPFGNAALRVSAITVEPADRLVPDPGMEVALRVTATLSDGSKREVTPLALFNSNDDAIGEVNRSGVVTTRGRGLTSIMVRFGGQVAAARIAVPYEAVAEQQPFPARNFIDEEIAAELKRLRLPASGLSDDATFLRRASLDITGTLPITTKAREWIGGPRSVEDREQLIDELLRSESFIDFWTLKFADLLLISGKRGSEQATLAYHRWLRAQIATNAPWDQIARALITASGDTTRNGPANFVNLANDPRDLSEYASEILLGTRLACARCHAHPSDRWTRDDYYEFAAVFAQISRSGNVIGRNAQGVIEHPKTRKPVTARLLGESGSVPEGDPREALADWLTDGNPLFARAMVNRVWKHLLGRGLVEPVDDLRPTNPATHPALLEKLARQFAAHGYDLRWLIKTIASSRTYQLAGAMASNAADGQFYSHAQLKPLPAQVLLDAIAQVTGVPENFASVPEGTRAVQLVGAQTASYALDVFGRCRRERVCEPAASGGGLAQALHLINGETINSRLSRGILAELLSKRSNRELITELYLGALTRLPRAPEVEFWEQNLASDEKRTEAAEDFLWTLLNCREFAYNH